MNGTPRIRRWLVRFHLWAGLGVGALWALQGLTGALLVFHREVDAAMVSGTPGPAASLDRVRAVAAAGGAREVVRIGVRDASHRTLTVDTRDAAGRERTLLLDARDARPLLIRDTDPAGPGGGGTSRWLYELHEALLLGDRGETLIGVSGLLLLGAALVGAWLGWPRLRTWRVAFSPRRWRTPALRLYGWHRAVGLIAAAAFAIAVPTGAWMTFAAALKPLLATVVPMAAAAPVEPPTGPARLGPERAWRIAQATFPDAAFVRVTLPSARQFAYVVRLHRPGEARAWSGTTSVTVSAATGRILDRYDPLTAPLANRLADLAYPLHSGEIAGLFGRVAVMLAGFSLPLLWITGLLAWLRKRGRRTRHATAA